MSDNSILNKAKYSEDTDEWYTDYNTVVYELSHYREQFYGKTVLCNCDDPYKSAFSNYFLKYFNILKLKKLICTSYKGSHIVEEFNLKDERHNKINKNYAYVLEVTEINDGKDEIVDDSVVFTYLKSKNCVKKLKGDGDFRSKECVNYLKESDIIVTNPPFSKFIELFVLINKYNKKYLLIGNQNAITYKEIFPYIINGQAWIGYQFGEMSFKVPSNTKPRNTRFWIDEKGQKWRSLGNAMWLTNLENERKHLKLELKEYYDPGKYPRYDNYDAINISKVFEIPKDYEGTMGVPLTYLKYYDKEQFEIVGEANHGADNEFDLFKPTINGKETFKRLLIRNKRCMYTNKKFRILDLFCGAGGMSYGMHKNPHFSTVLALDIDEKLSYTFKKNMPNAEVIVGDIKEDKVKQHVINLAKQLNVNMIIGGPPCQGFSLKGKKLGLKDPRNFLFVEYLKIVEELKPEVFVIENVKALLSTSNGWFKNEIVTVIEELGYKVKVGVLKATDFGIPQTRERAIFICSKTKIIDLPLPTCDHLVTVRDAIGDLSYLEANEGEFEQGYRTEPKTRYQKLMRKNSKKLYNHKASKHAKIAIEKLKMIPPEKGKECLPDNMKGKQKYNTTWGRLKWDEPSPTIDTRFDAASNGTNNHPYLNRAITPREAARIQSFDDNFVFYGNKVSVRTQIGNAVPPLMAKAVADQIYEILGKKDNKGDK